MSIRTSLPFVSFESSTSLLFFAHVINRLRVVLNSPSVVIHLSVSPFSSVSFGLRDFEAKLLGACTLVIALSFQ